MKIIKIFCLICVLIASGCSKDQLLQKRIQALWTFGIYTKTIYQNNTPLLTESGSAANAGTIDFGSDGKGYYSMVFDLGTGAFNNNGNFTWTNTSDKVTIYVNDTIKVYDVVTNTINKIELHRVVNNFDLVGHSPDYTYSLDEFMSLVK
ncbi:MAG: hypothetical protein NTW49_10610 [Bacteroidia bacterium]|nr:hypothetical protein [Bacteroidia bacterium]